MSSMEFTLSISNCLSCHFCPQDKLGAAYNPESPRIMSVGDFSIILERIPKDCQIHFSGFAEPFLNPNAAEMIAVASDDGREVHVYTTLVGLKPMCVPILKTYPPRVFRIHVPDGNALKFPEEKWVELHEIFLLTKIKASYMAMQEPSDFIKRHLAIKEIMLDIPDMLSRGGNLAHVPGKNIRGKMRCTMMRWYNNVVLPNGDVYGCCMDYSLSVPLGNLLRDPYELITTRSNEWRQRMENNAEGICAMCEWATPA